MAFPEDLTPDAIADILRAAGCIRAEDEAAMLIETVNAAGDDEHDGPETRADDGNTSASASAHLIDMVEQRVAGQPIETIVGWAELCDMRFVVAPGVFVPRPRSELLASEAARLTPTGAVVVDMCCGCGALGAIVATHVSGVELHAADIDTAALACARENLDGIGTVHAGDLYAALPEHLRGRVSTLIANTPYVPGAEIALMPRDARDHEPRIALDGGADGLDVQRRVAAGAADWLAPGGVVLVEASADQASASADIFRAAGLAARIAHDDELDATVVIGTRPG